MANGKRVCEPGRPLYRSLRLQEPNRLRDGHGDPGDERRGGLAGCSEMAEAVTRSRPLSSVCCEWTATRLFMVVRIDCGKARIRRHPMDRRGRMPLRRCRPMIYDAQTHPALGVRQGAGEPRWGQRPVPTERVALAGEDGDSAERRLGGVRGLPASPWRVGCNTSHRNNQNGHE